MSSTQYSNYLSPEEEEEAFLHAFQLAIALVLPMALKAAIELDVLEIIAKAGHGAFISPSDIVSQLSTNNPDATVMLDRILRLLASYKVLNCTLRTLEDGEIERLYGLAPVCRFLVKSEDGVSLAPLLRMHHDKVLMESWYHLKNVVLEGGSPFKKAYGMGLFEYYGTDPRFNEVFNIAMSDFSTITMKKMLQTYKGFDGLQSVVDVGGGTGATINMIVSKHPTIKGINFDLPSVIEIAPSYPGVEHIGGDMFVSIPKGDAIFMKFILHGYGDEDCVKLLKDCREALPENGKVIVVDSIVPVFPETDLAAKNVFKLDLVLLGHSPGGKERTREEFEALSLGAGFAGFNVAFSAFNTCVMEFCKKI